jgi:hypothetical protein
MHFQYIVLALSAVAAVHSAPGHQSPASISATDPANAPLLAAPERRGTESELGSLNCDGQGSNVASNAKKEAFCYGDSPSSRQSRLYRRSPTRPGRGKTLKSLEPLKERKEEVEKIEATRIAKEKEEKDLIGITICPEYPKSVWFFGDGHRSKNFGDPPQMTNAELKRLSPDDATDGGDEKSFKRAKLSHPPSMSADETARLVMHRKKVPKVVQELISSFATSSHGQRKEAVANGEKESNIAILDTVQSHFWGYTQTEGQAFTREQASALMKNNLVTCHIKTTEEGSKTNSPHEINTPE